MKPKAPSLFCCPFLMLSLIVTATCSGMQQKSERSDEQGGVAILLVDADRETGTIRPQIYGHFLEHINHSVVDGLYAEQVRGQGFEGKDFETYWTAEGAVSIIKGTSVNGTSCIKLSSQEGVAGISQARFHIQEGVSYNGSVWVQATGIAELLLKVTNETGVSIAEIPLNPQMEGWHELSYAFTASQTTRNGDIEIWAAGGGDVLIDFISLMPSEVRKKGMLRPDLLQSLKDLAPPFVRWPGGSFASIYKWKDGIGPLAKRTFNPNAIWGDYSDYYGFGTEEFMGLCKQLETEPMIVLKATSTDPEEVENAMDWVHYLLDPPTTEWGKMRAANGHPEPYRIPYFQIDNEPMNHGLSPEAYAEIVNVYGSRLRAIASESRIVACGQKRSNDMIWTQKLVDIAGGNFDILGCHNYEYEPENYQIGVRRIEDYLEKAVAYIRNSEYPDITIGVLEWGLCRTYDWRAGLHAAGSLISYEKLSPEVEMSCPALLMRNTEDNPEWTAFIYHDHVSWFPGSGYVVEKLFREHYAPIQLASTSGTFKDREDRTTFFDDISQMKPEDYKPGTIDAIATLDKERNKVVIKAVNYEAVDHTLLVRLQGNAISANAAVTLYTMSADPSYKPSLEEPDKLKPTISSMPFKKDLSFKLAPYSVIVVEVLKKD